MRRMRVEHKYVRHSKTGFIVWKCHLGDGSLSHGGVGYLLCAENSGEILSAGFVSFENGQPKCGGRSDGLNIRSRDDDSEALAKQLGLLNRSPTTIGD